LIYPAAKLDEEGVAALTDIWASDMAEERSLTNERFREAVVFWRKRREFFPTVADILNTRRELDFQVRPYRQGNGKAIEHRPSNIDQSRKVVSLVAEIRRRNTAMGYSDAYTMARRRVEKGDGVA
jgi:hypothetical protein